MSSQPPITLTAYANFESGDRAAAGTAAEQLGRIAKTEEDKRTSDRILAQLDGPRKTALPRGPVDGTPRIQRRAAPESTLEVRTELPKRPSFSGRFVELQ